VASSFVHWSRPQRTASRQEVIDPPDMLEIWFERWMTPLEAAEELALDHLRAQN